MVPFDHLKNGKKSKGHLGKIGGSINLISYHIPTKISSKSTLLCKIKQLETVFQRDDLQTKKPTFLFFIDLY